MIDVCKFLIDKNTSLLAKVMERTSTMKVKIFSSPDPRILEKEVNQWIEDNSWITVINLTQSTGTSTVISLWYNEPNVPILG
ncbi:hypothetical protein JCM17380_39070 [Desulfosporosinus burensis]